MVQFRLMLIAFIGAASVASASAALEPNTTEIAPGVEMPFINLGGVEGSPSNHSLWIELGGRGLDTALQYGVEVQGEVGHAIATSATKRADLFLTTKIPCCPNPPLCETRNTTTAEDLEADLQQLGVDYLDLVLLHWSCHNMEDTVAAYQAMEKFLANGKTRAIGISNFNASQIDKLMKETTILPAVNQCGFSIGNHYDSSIGRDYDTIHRCEELGITYAAYSPLGGLTGDFDVLDDPDVKLFAARHQKSPAQVALRWVVQQGVVAVTASDQAKYDSEDLDIFDFTLTDNEMEFLKEK